MNLIEINLNCKNIYLTCFLVLTHFLLNIVQNCSLKKRPVYTAQRHVVYHRIWFAKEAMQHVCTGAVQRAAQSE